MAITDNLAILIKAETGQTVITDSIASLSVNTGAGTVTNVDDATYGPIWRLTGGSKSATLSGMGEWMNTNSTTVAMRFRVSNRAANYSRFMIMGSTSDSGLVIGNGGTSTGGLRVGVQIGGSTVGSVAPPTYTTGTVITAVIRFVEGATDAYSGWYNTIGRSVTGPDYSVTSTTASAYRARALLQFLTVSENLDIIDYAMWTRGLTNDEAAAVADDIRTTLYPSGAVTHVTTGALTAGAATVAGTSAHIATHVTSGALVAGAATLDGTAAREGAATTHVTTGALVAGAATLDGTASHAASGSFVSDVLGNNTSSIWASTAVVWEWREGTGIGVAPTSVTYGTGTTSSLGVLTCTGLPTGAGELLIATTDYTGVAYQRGTVA